MNAHAARCENRALVNTWSRRVYRDGEFVGRVHPTDDQQWVAEIVGRLVLGIIRPSGSPSSPSSTPRGAHERALSS